MSVVSSYLLIFILNLSEFNTPIKGQWLNGYKTRTKKTAEVPIFYWTKQTLSETAMEDKKDIIKKKKLIHQEDVTIIITYTLITRAPQNKH